MQVQSSINLDNEASIEGPKSGATSAGPFRPPKLCPPTVGGHRLGGRVSGLEAAPVLGSALGRVQERVCAWLRSQRRRKVSQLWSCYAPPSWLPTPISPLLFGSLAVLQSSTEARPFRESRSFHHQFQPPRRWWSIGSRHTSNHSRTSARRSLQRLESQFCGEV